MERLITRIKDNVYYSKGEYAPTTLCAEMTSSEVRECMSKLAEYEDLGMTPDEVYKTIKAGVPEWVPISERLPTKEEYNQNDGRFIVTDGNRRYQSLFDIYEKEFFVDIIYKGNCNFEQIVDNKVLAWKPMPEPYKED